MYLDARVADSYIYIYPHLDVAAMWLQVVLVSQPHKSALLYHFLSIVHLAEDQARAR